MRAEVCILGTLSLCVNFFSNLKKIEKVRIYGVSTKTIGWLAGGHRRTYMSEIFSGIPLVPKEEDQSPFSTSQFIPTLSP